MNEESNLINLFLDFLKLYRWTESFYTDLAYKEINNSKILKNNLIKLESVKTTARKYLNSFFNGKNSYLQQMSKKSKNSENFLHMTVDEIINNIGTPVEEINLRKENHLIDNLGKIHEENDALYREIKKWKHSLEITKGKTINGISASLGCVKGRAFVLSADFTNYDTLDKIIKEMPENIVLVSETTSPDIVRACYKAIGIVTNQGGLGSHAAIISRELNIPCVVGTKIATKVIKTGDMITLNGNKGEVTIDD